MHGVYRRGNDRCLALSSGLLSSETGLSSLLLSSSIVPRRFESVRVVRNLHEMSTRRREHSSVKKHSSDNEWKFRLAGESKWENVRRCLSSDVALLTCPHRWNNETVSLLSVVARLPPYHAPLLPLATPLRQTNIVISEDSRRAELVAFPWPRISGLFCFTRTHSASSFRILWSKLSRFFTF